MDMLKKMAVNLQNCPDQLSLLHSKTQMIIKQNKILQFVKSRKALMEKVNSEFFNHGEADTKLKKLDVFKEVYMRKKDRKAYFELLKMHHVEVYRRFGK